ncbi:MAG: ABC transporter permease [Actinobacteria bacterium]|nr:ABC transporter permease [Actinomycetota bacterium]
MLRLSARLGLGWNWKIATGASIVVGLLVVSLLARLSPYDPIRNDLTQTFLPPSLHHPFGTDNLGRDVLIRVLYATHVDLIVAVLGVAVPFILGGILGLSAGYFGGKWDAVIMRITDVALSFPFMVLALAAVAVLGPGLRPLFLVLFLLSWTAYARVVRAGVLVVKQQEYVVAARTLGYGSPRIVFRHVLPNALGSAVVYAMSDMVLVILFVASMSFLGLGVQPPSPEWGAIIADGRLYLRAAWWISTLPGLVILLMTFALSLVGDGLAEYLEGMS